MTEISSLEKRFHKVSNDIYNAFASELNACQTKFTSLKDLNKQLVALKLKDNQVIGVCLIQKNNALIKNHIDSKEIFFILRYLLDNNHFELANQLFAVAKRDGDKSLVSNISFIFARYYSKRKEWNKVSQLISANYNDLSFEDANYARIIAGIALQKNKQHRKAVNIYSKISNKSKYYAAAQMNIATAYLRQDWWTDAHIKINEILNNKKYHQSKELINRLYLVLGYSLLRKEYYRDAREAFRNIEINSIYSNKALLGIALTATSQEDFISALNAINILKSKKTYDLTVDESYLLLPYIYEKLKQNLTASASYTTALDYYKQRIEDINKIESQNILNIKASDIINNDYIVTINNNSIRYTEDYPESFLNNSKVISSISGYIKEIESLSVKNSFNLLKKQYDKVLSDSIKTLLSRRSIRLNNYMNQSRFGLARLFDSTRTGDN